MVPASRIASFLLVGSLALAGCSDIPAPAASRPELVLVVVVDQMRQEYLHRFAPQLEGGMARLLEDGAAFSDAHLAHYPSVTAIGHATLLTGASPGQSGIVGNDWFDRSLGHNVVSVQDETVALLGADGEGRSPRWLLASTVGDELKTANADAKVIGISRKDRAAILSVGGGADGAFWVDGGTGRFVSSSWYFDALPAWVQELNEQDPTASYAGRAWEPLGGGEAFMTLPEEPGEALADAIGATPFSNEMLVDLAEVALTAERLGRRGVTDLLMVSFSANDSIGHEYGPESPQLRDVTLRTDRVLQRLFDAVDRTVGLSNVLVVFTSDHGVAPLPEEQAKRHQPGGRMTGAELFDPIEAALDARFGPEEWIRGKAGSSPYLDYALIDRRGLSAALVRQTAAEAAAGVDHVARVFTRDQLLRGDVPQDPMSLAVADSYHPRRSGDLEILLDPFWMRAGHGTTHGTPYTYDTHIPLIFMGPGVRPGRYHGRVALNDVAATLATLLAVELPSGCSGRVLNEMMMGSVSASVE